jgi:hypothetical protein
LDVRVAANDDDALECAHDDETETKIIFLLRAFLPLLLRRQQRTTLREERSQATKKGMCGVGLFVKKKHFIGELFV